jgi:hypothetical protein
MASMDSCENSNSQDQRVAAAYAHMRADLSCGFDCLKATFYSHKVSNSFRSLQYFTFHAFRFSSHSFMKDVLF